MKTFTIEEIEAFKQLCKPLLDFLYEHGTPHSKIIIEQTGAEFVDGTIGVPFKLRD